MMRMNLLTLIVLLPIGFSLSAEIKPNIVYILADDLGWSDTGCYGAKFYKTPTIDALAASGIRFTNAYANSPNCAPSRAAIISGQYCGRTGMYNVGYSARGKGEFRSMISPTNTGTLPLDKATIGNAMKSAGYSTAYFGKWHMGDFGDYTFDKRGFDEGFQVNNPTKNGYWKIAPYPSLLDIEAQSGVKYEEGKTYLGDFITDNAVSYIDRHADDEKPFFMMVGQFLVHGPKEAPKETIKVAEKESKVAPNDPGDHDFTLAAMTKELDKCVRLIQNKLEEKGLLENTMIVFMSDNGGVGGYKASGVKGATDYTSNLPLKGGKTNLYEGGVRVPLIVSWKGKIVPGRVSSDLITGLDLYPTFLDVAGVNLASYTQERKYPLDGISFKDHWLSNQEVKRTEPVVFHFPAYALAPKAADQGFWRSTPMAAVNDGEYKMVIHLPSGKKELYRLDDDINESNDLSTKNRDVVDRLSKRYKDWLVDTEAKLPVKRDENGVNWQERLYQENNDHLKRILMYNGQRNGVVLVDFATPKGMKKDGVVNEIMLELNGMETNSLEELKKAVANLIIGQTVVYKYSFAGKVKSRSIKVTSNMAAPIQYDLKACTDLKSSYSPPLIR